MPRGKVAFVVEGELEKDFLQKQCATKTVIRKIPSNGENVAIERLASMIKAILDTLDNPTRVFVILDRERRQAAAEELEATLLNEIVSRGIALPISVHIADRMVENWIIADPEALASEQLVIDATEGTEGVGGKGKLKKAFRDQNQTYSERVDGVRLLERSVASVIATNSPSFSRLYASMQAAALPCAWIQR
jgi:hypothetical protein